MKYYIIAGEASGDLHASNLIKELKKLDIAADFRCWGGDLMQAEGGVVVKHYKDLAFMGFVEVVSNLNTIFKNLRFCKEDILRYQPDALILIDYPGFNLRIAKWAHELREGGTATGKAGGRPGGKADKADRVLGRMRIIYYISPQIWAWKESRVKQIKKNVDRMLVILPFEKDFYKKWDYAVEYVGHPLVEAVESFKLQATSYKLGREVGAGSIVALLPGSRKQEILKKLPIMLTASGYFPDIHFVVAKAPGLEDDFYDALLAGYPNVSSVANQTYSLLAGARAACVTSGTATLETALFGVPEVVCYKGSAVSYQIARRLIKVKYISLVNLIMDKEVVKELIQDELTPENLRKELERLLHDPARQQQIRSDYATLKKLLSLGGHASANAARIIVDFMD